MGPAATGFSKFLVRSRSLAAGFPCFGYHLANLRRENRDVIAVAVLDGPFNPACVNLSTILDGFHASRVKYLDVLEWIAVYNNQISHVARANASDLVLNPENPGVI